jgi:hypothetical protein
MVILDVTEPNEILIGSSLGYVVPQIVKTTRGKRCEYELRRVPCGGMPRAWKGRWTPGVPLLVTPVEGDWGGG